MLNVQFFLNIFIFHTSDSTAIAESFADDVDNKGSSNSSREISGTISGLQKRKKKNVKNHYCLMYTLRN